MKNLYLLLITFLLLLTGRSQDTFSICAIDTITGEIGSAGASCIGAPPIPQGCYILSDVLPGIGVIHTQAAYWEANQTYAHSLMVQGLSPQQIIDSLIANDAQNNPTIRQYGIVDLYEGSPRTAAYTGINCLNYKNHIIGPNYTIQGNILLGQQILDSMEARFLNTEGELACKLMAALQGAKVIGADTRCLDDGVSSLSSFLRVAKPNDPPNGLYLDFNIPSTPVGLDPIDSLQTLIDEWGGCLTSGSFNNTQLKDIYVYPNPAKDILIINSNEILGDGCQFLLIDISGEKVMSKEGIINNTITIPDDINNGLYFYLLQNEEGILTKGKLIINRIKRY